MINWRNGKGGFVGGLKTAIRGFFQYAHSITSDTVITPTASFGVISLINDDGLSVRSNMGSTGLSVESEISTSGVSVWSPMDNTGLGLESGF